MAENGKPAQAPAQLAKVAASGVETAQPARVSTRLRDHLLDRAQEDAANDGELHEVTAAQLDKILTGTSLEDIMNADMMSTYETRDLIGAKFRIPPQRLRVASSFDEFSAPLGVYVQFQGIALEDVEGTDLSAGDQAVISSGAPLVIGKLRALEANELFPVDVQIVGAKATGGTVIKLKLVKTPATGSKNNA